MNVLELAVVPTELLDNNSSNMYVHAL